MKTGNDQWDDNPENKESGGPPPKNTIWKHLFLIFLLALIFYEFFLYGSKPKERMEIPYSEFKEELTGRNIKEIITRNEIIEGEFIQSVSMPISSGKEEGKETEYLYFTTHIPEFGDQDLMRELTEADVIVTAKKGNEWLLA